MLVGLSNVMAVFVIRTVTSKYLYCIMGGVCMWKGKGQVRADAMVLFCNGNWAFGVWVYVGWASG